MSKINPNLPDLFHIETDDSYGKRIRTARATGQNPPLGITLCGKRSADVVNFWEVTGMLGRQPDDPGWTKCCQGCLWTLKTMMGVATE